MTDSERAIQTLAGHTLAACKGDRLYVSDRRGIAPMLEWLAEGKNLFGFSVADLVVGKAAAMLFVKAGVAHVFARTLSQGGKTVLERYKIPFSYEVLTERIINRAGSDVCPMEKAVSDTEDIEEAYRILRIRSAELNRPKI